MQILHQRYDGKCLKHVKNYKSLCIYEIISSQKIVKHKWIKKYFKVKLTNWSISKKISFPNAVKYFAFYTITVCKKRGHKRCWGLYRVQSFKVGMSHKCSHVCAPKE